MKSSSRRVVFISPSPFLGGAELSLVTLLTAVAFSATLLVPNSLIYKSLITNSRITILEFPFVRPVHKIVNFLIFPLSLLRFFFFLLKYRREFPRILLVSNNHYGYPYVFVASLIKGIEYFVFVRDYIRNNQIWWMYLVFVRAKRVICISKTVANRVIFLMGKVAKKKIILFENRFDFSHFRKRPKLNQKFRRITNIAIVGEVVPWKNHKFFIDLAEVLLNQKNIRFHVIGDNKLGGNEEYKEQILRRCKALPNVVFHGYIKNTDPLFEKIHYLILPSINEPFGRVVVEAMYMSKIVFVEKSAGVAHYISNGKNGFIFSHEKDLEKVANTILDLAKSKIRKDRISKHAHKTVERHFDVRTLTKKKLSFFSMSLS